MKRYLLLATVILWSILPTTHAQEKQKGFAPSESEEKLLALTNVEREKAKLPPLKFSLVLGEVAHKHAANMAKQGKMEHDLDGKTPYDRIKGAGYKYSQAAENVARGRLPLAGIMKGWMDSQFHRDNILDPDFTEIGIGAFEREDGETYYTQVFAKPRK